MGLAQSGRPASHPPDLGILYPQPLIDECHALAKKFDKVTFGVHMSTEKLERLKFLLDLSQLPIDEEFRLTYKGKLVVALRFREHFEALRAYIKEHGYGEFKLSTLLAMEKQRTWICPNDRRLEWVVQKGIQARKKGVKVVVPEESGAGAEKKAAKESSSRELTPAEIQEAEMRKKRRELRAAKQEIEKRKVEHPLDVLKEDEEWGKVLDDAPEPAAQPAPDR